MTEPKLKNTDEKFENSNKVVNLFQFVPFNEENINKLALLINPEKKLLGDDQESLRNSFQIRTEGFLNKEMFYVKNSNDKNFIETLLEMDKPSSYEEIHVRVYLLSFFFNRGLNNVANNALINDEEKRKLFMEQISKVTEKYYEEFCSTKNITPKHSLNDYVEKLNNIARKNKPLAETREELKEVLKEFYAPFNNIQINNAWEGITPMALISKMVVKFYDKGVNLRSLTAELYFQTISEEYQYEENRQLLIQIGSSMLPDLVKSNFLLPKKEGSTRFEERGLIDYLSLTVLTDLISEILLNNKILMSYETLNAELESNEKVKPKKTKL